MSAFLLETIRTRQDLDQILTGQKYKNIGRASRSQYVARTLTGFINALAEGAEGLEVEIESRPDTPVWDKHVDNVKVKFQRYVFFSIYVLSRVYLILIFLFIVVFNLDLSGSEVQRKAKMKKLELKTAAL